MRTRGRPRKPVEEKYVARVIRFPPEVLAELDELVPFRKRSAFIHEEVKRGLGRLRRKRGKVAESGEKEVEE